MKSCLKDAKISAKHTTFEREIQNTFDQIQRQSKTDRIKKSKEKN